MVSAFGGSYSLAWSAGVGSTLISSRPRLRTRSRTPYRWDWSRISPTRTVWPGAASSVISPKAEPRRSVNRPRTLIRYRTGATFFSAPSGPGHCRRGTGDKPSPGRSITRGDLRDDAVISRARDVPHSRRVRAGLRSARGTAPALTPRLLPGRDAQLAVDVPGMGLHCVVGDEQLAGDLPQGKLAVQPAQDFLLPHAQRLGGPAAGHAGGTGTRSQRSFGPGQQRGEHAGVGAAGDDPPGGPQPGPGAVAVPAVGSDPGQAQQGAGGLQPRPAPLGQLQAPDRGRLGLGGLAAAV